MSALLHTSTGKTTEKNGTEENSWILVPQLCPPKTPPQPNPCHLIFKRP